MRKKLKSNRGMLRGAGKEENKNAAIMHRVQLSSTRRKPHLDTKAVLSLIGKGFLTILGCC